LILLAKQPNQLVTRETIRNEFWPDDRADIRVIDLRINTIVKELRDALADNANRPRYIETERKEGFKFIAPVTDLAPSDGQSLYLHSVEASPPKEKAEGPQLAGNAQGRQDLGRPRSTVERRIRLLLVAGALVVAVGIAVFILRPRGHAEVSEIKIFGRHLVASKNGREAWSYDFNQPLREEFVQPPYLDQRSLIQDVNEDGRKEVLLAPPLLFAQKGDSSTDALFCFSSEGKVLWQRAFRDRMRFHGDDAGPRWEFGAMTTAPDGPKTSIWFTICEPYLSTSILFKMYAQGAATPYFVNYGHLRTLHRMQTPTGSYILAGGISNDANCAMLAVLRDSAASGHSPAINTPVDCDGCPPGQPIRYFLFPRTEVCKVIGEPYNDTHAITSTDGRLKATTAETFTPPPEAPHDWAMYDFTTDFEPKSVMLSDDYWKDHRRLSAEGKIKHSVEDCPERLKPIVVKMWTPESGWKDVALPPIAMATARR
jgi:DNA-binding winged helix-turn-helix (wHTH) protein